MKRLLILFLLSLSNLNAYAHNCGGQFDPATGSCRIIGPDGKQIIYNSDPPQTGYGTQDNSSPPPKIIHHTIVNIPSKYGALASDKNTGGVGDAVNADSLAEAKKMAIRQCSQGGKHKNCKVISWVRNGCIAAAGGKLNSKWLLYKAAEKPGHAEKVAMSRCQAAGVSECQIIVPEGCSIP